ncbi:Gar1/Naf1 RNA binding region-domain-containing protein [Hysterangium stoloniferum]|nr:Gar1/Naf1 RNA binding region-domain-containing protein [Hysterangium stoloniferum]
MDPLETPLQVKIEDTEYDIASSGTESEDEVAAGLMLQPKVKSEDLDLKPIPSDSDSDSDSDEESARKLKTSAPVLDMELDEDGPPLANNYIPTAHELPPTAIPIPPLPDPATLPQDILELVGEISTVLPDSVIVRGGALATAPQRRDAVLDEGSLLLFHDRTPLGYVWETFGPTSLPHYIIRIQRSKDTTIQTFDSATDPTLTVPEITSSYSGPDPSKLNVSQSIYHLPSLSNFVFPGVLVRIKGSDASNLHDEEPDEHELEFSDDEAEAAHRKSRRCGDSRVPSLAPSAHRFGNAEDDAVSTVGDDAHSLYGVSPYDFEDVSTLSYDPPDITPSTSHSTQNFDAPPAAFQNPIVRDALMNARNSRHRRHDHGQSQPRSRGGRGRGRGRGSRGAGNWPRSGEPREAHQSQTLEHSSFSFEEYDPRVPRPPSPTSIAIARATGQWADGTPFPYESESGSGSYEPQVTAYNNSYPSQFQEFEYQQAQVFEHQQTQTLPYGIAPHINPRFAQAFGLSVPLTGSQDRPMNQPKEEDIGPPV